MVRACFSVLEKEETERIHEGSLWILAKVGLRICSAKALKLLADAGAEVNNKGFLAKIPEHLVAEAIRNCKKEFALCSRDGRHDLPIPATIRPWVSTDGICTDIIDARTSERAMSLNDDLARFVRLADALEPVDFIWPMANPGDFPARVQSLRAFFTTLENTGKHLQHEALNAHMARVEIQAASMLTDGEKELMRHPIFSAVQCSIAPLVFEEGMIEASMEFARSGIPVVYMSMPMMGGSAPVTIAGALALGHAETLGGIVISQLTKKGSPVFHSILAGPMDMETGVYASGSCERAIADAASTQLAKHLGIPNEEGGFSTAAKVPGMQSGYEKIATMIPPAMAGADLITAIGSLDSSICISMVQAVMDAEMWTYVQRMLRGIKVSDDSLSLKSIKEVGPGGFFLRHRETLAKYRSERWVPTLGQHQPYEKWVSDGRIDMAERARDRALTLSSKPSIDELPREIKKDLEDMFEAEVKAL